MKLRQVAVYLVVATLLALLLIHSFSPEEQLTATTLNMQEKSELRIAIRKRAAEVYQPAIDARIDQVWRAIPGYNGVVLDVERTFRDSLISWANHKTLTERLRQIEPLVQLSDLPAEPIYRGNSNKKMVSLMINVAWGEEHLPSMLSTLAAARAKATFFLDGSWLAKHPELAVQLLAAGHEISNHAYSHKNMSQLTDSEASLEISKTEQLLSKLDVNNRLFAPPSGDFDSRTVELARKQGLQTILWTIDTVDWRKPPSNQIVSKVKRLLEPGALILMHPTESSANALGDLIRVIHSRQLRIGTVSELISSLR